VYVFLDVVLLCRLVAEPQCELRVQAWPTCMRLSDPKVMVDSLADDARTTPPPAEDSRVANPHVLVKMEREVLLGTSERRPPQELLT
jgi:hypothetical protein